MIIKLEEKVDILKLKEYLSWVIQNYPPNMKGGGVWGGWSITSANGNIDDGWQSGEKVNDPSLPATEKKQLKEFFETKNFNSPTALFTGYIKDVLEIIAQADRNIRVSRIRIAVLKPHDESEAYWHRDGDNADSQRHFRLHIPIISNDQCFFDYENERHHLNADGSIYIIEISKSHRAVNLSREERYHLIMNISYSK